MSDFSPDDYFTRKLEQSGASLPDISFTPEAREKRFEEVMKASEAKLNTLQEIRNQRAISEQQNAQSLVSKMGLDPEGTVGKGVNAVANVSQGAMSHVLGNITSFIAADVPAMILDGQLQDHEIEAINRYKMGKASAADIDLITSKQIQRMEGITHNPNMDSPEALATREASAQNNPLVRTPLELFEASSQVKKFGEKIDKAFDYSKMVHQEAREKFTNDLKRDFQPSWDKTGLANLFSDDKEIGNAKDIAAGLGELMVNAGDAIINNPTGFSEYVFENTPQLLVGALPKVGATILTATNVGYATEQYRKGIAEFQAANNGAVPSKEQRKEMAMWAATAGLMEHVTDTSLLKSIKGPADEAVDATRKSFKATLGSAAATVGTAATTGTAKEGITEGVQTYAEAKAQLKDPDAADIYVGTVIGGGAGGVMTGSGSAVVEGVKTLAAIPSKGKGDPSLTKRINEDRATFDAAVAANDPAVFLDPNTPTFDPGKAIAVLAQANKAKDATPDVKEANLKRVAEIVSDLDNKFETEKQAYLTNVERTPEEVATYEAALAKKREEFADPANAAKMETLAKQISGITKILAESQTEAIELQKLALDKTERNMFEARKIQQLLANNKEVISQVKEQLAAANKEVDAQDTVAVQKAQEAASSLITLSMKSPLSVTGDEALALANNSKNALTTEQRSYWRTLSEARTAENALKSLDEVAQQIYFGSKVGTGQKYVGIKEYQDRITDAINLNRLNQANDALRSITAFAKDHSAKADIVATAWKTLQEKAHIKTVQILSDGKGGWSINTGAHLDQKALSKNGGLNIHGGSTKLVESIPQEALALNAATALFKMAVDLRFKSKPATASVTPAVQAPASPTPAASVPSANKPNIKEPKVDLVNGRGDVPSLHQEVLLKDGSIVKVNPVGKEYFDGDGNIIDPSIVVAWRNEGKGEQWFYPRHLQSKTDTAPAVVAAAETAKAVEEKKDTKDIPPWEDIPVDESMSAINEEQDSSIPPWEDIPEESGNSTKKVVGSKAKDQAPQKEIVTAEEKSVDSASLDRTDENSGSTVRPTETVGDTTQKTTKESKPAWESTFVPGTQADIDALVELGEVHPDFSNLQALTFRGLTQDEAFSLETAAVKIAQLFSKELGKVKFLIKTGSKAKGSAVSFNDKHTILLDPKLFTTEQGIEFLTHLVAHEIAHIRDFMNGSYSWAEAKLRKGGSIYNEIQGILNTKGELAPSFSYIFDPEKQYASDPKKVVREIFAQLHALYITKPEILKNAIPEAYALIAANHGQATTDSVPVHDKARSTEDRGDTPTVAEDTVSRQPAVETAPGILKVFTDASLRLVRATNETMTEFYNRLENGVHVFNPVAQFLKQNKVNEKDASVRPLVAVEDFIRNWTAGNINAEEYLDLNENGSKRVLTDEEKSALKNLQEFINEWMPQIERNFKAYKPKQNAEFKTDLMQSFYTVQPDGSVTAQENVKAAIAYAMYSYILDRAGAPALKTKEEVVQMHKAILQAHDIHEESPSMLPAGFSMLQQMDLFEHTLIEELGQRAIQALGIVPGSKDVPQDILPRLATAFGTHGMIALNSAPLDKNGFPIKGAKSFIDITAVPQNDVYAAFGITPEVRMVDLKDKNGNPVLDENGEPEQKEIVTTISYIRFNRSPETREDGSVNKFGLSPTVRKMKDAATGSQGVVDKLFGVEHEQDEVLTVPTPMTQEHAQGTKQKITALQKEAINNTQQEKHSPIADMFKLRDIFGRETILIAAGWVKIEENDPNYHEINLPGIEANNRNLENQYDQMEALLTKHGMDKYFYVLQSVWRNFRAGFTNGSLNQQSSKIHRFMFGRPQWTTSIDFSKDADMVNEFLISIAMAMGEKTDKQRNSVSLEKYYDNLNGVPVLKNEQMMEAIRVLQKAMNTEGYTVTTEEITLIQEVAAGAEGMMSLQAMNAFAKFLQAKESGDTSFEFTLLVGADGKTNGPMLTLFALGAKGYDTMHRGGFFNIDDKYEHFSEFAESGEEDLYQNTGRATLANAKTKLYPDSQIEEQLANYWNQPEFKRNPLGVPFSMSQYQAFTTLTGTLEDEHNSVTSALRNLIKTPLTAFFFGSSLKGSAKSMENAFIDSWYDSIQNIKQGKAKNGLTIQSLVNATNTLIKTGNPEAAIIEFPVEVQSEAEMIAFMMQYMLHKNPAQDAAFRAGFQIVMGNSVQSAFEPYFSTFLYRRNMLSQSVHAAHAVYLAAYNTARVQLIKELKEKGELAQRVVNKVVDGKRVPKLDENGNVITIDRQDLTIAQEEELQRRVAALRPLAHTAMSKQESNLEAGYYMGKEIKDPSKDAAYTSEVLTQQGDRKNIATAKHEVNNGVGSLSAFIHSLDSSNMHAAMLKVRGSMNVHDEIGNGLRAIAKAAKAINQTTAEYMLNFSPTRESFEMLERSVLALAEGIKNGTYDKATLDSVLEAWAEEANQYLPYKERITADLALTRILSDGFDNANMADKDRLTMLAQLKSVDQYTWENGQFIADQAFRDQAQTMLDTLPKEFSPELKEAMAVLKKALKTETKTEVVAVPKESKPDPVDASPAKESPFGKLGKSKVTHNAKLLALLEGKKEITVNEVLENLVRYFNSKDKDQTGNEQYRYFKHLAVLLHRLNRNPRSAFSTLTIKLVTPDMTADDVISVGGPGSMGWYSSSIEGEQAIYILSDAFEDSGITPELMLHEILHGLLARTIHAKGTSDPLIYSINRLYESVRVYAAEQGLETRYAAALENLDEFISWGMTNKAFQDEVLNKMEYTDRNLGNGWVKAMKAFITYISKALFPGKTASELREIDTAMTSLISNVSGLMGSHLDPNDLPADITLNQVSTVANKYTTQSLFEELNSGAVSHKFKQHLRGLLGNLVEKLHGPFGSFKEQFMSEAAGTSLDVWIKAKRTGVAPFASKIDAAGLLISDQEMFVIEQVEATVRSALADEQATSRAAYRQLVKLYNEARSILKPSDFTDPKTYDFIFNMENTGDRADYLSRFAALGLANEEVSKLLNVSTAKSKQASLATQTFREWLQTIFDGMLEWMGNRLAHTYGGQQADEKLNILVRQLVDIEAKRRITAAKKKIAANYPAMIDDKLGGVAQQVTGKLQEFSESTWFTNRKSGTLQAIGAVSATILGNRQQHFLAAVADFRDRRATGRQDLLGGFISELRDPNKLFHKMLRASKDRDKEMMHVKTQTERFVLNGFIENGKNLTKSDKDSLTAVALRTGMHSLLDGFTMQEIDTLLRDPKAMEVAIKKELQKLESFPKHKDYFLNQSKFLAEYLVTGKDHSDLLMKSAGNIARLYGTGFEHTLNEGQKTEAEAILDVLVTLYALSYSYQNDLQPMLEIFKKENARTDGGNGVQALLSLHKALEQQSKEKLFEGSEALIAKGYVPEIINQSIDIKIATRFEGQDLIDQGYLEIGEVVPDKADPDQRPKYMYRLRDAGKEALQTTIMAYQDLHTKGTSAVGGTHNSRGVQAVTLAKQQAIRNLFKPNPGMNPRKMHANNAAPVLNSKGEIVNWNYLMQHGTKNTVLQRDNRFDVLMGQLAGSIYDKATVTDNNTMLVNALYEIYDKEFTESPKSFVNIGPNSRDPEMREMYRLIPEATKKVIEEVWGKDGMVVRRDLQDLSFGYHKWSAANMFTKPEDERNAVEAAVVVAIEYMFEQWAHILNQTRGTKGLPLHDPVKYARRATHVVRRVERVWQEIVKEIKNIIIIKSGVVLAGNMASNFLQLKMNGVSWEDMIKNSLIAARGARDYQRDNNKLFQLQSQLDTGVFTGNRKDIEHEIARLKDALSRNPVKGMIDNGLMPTIVDDVDLEEDIYSYKSELTRKMEKYTNKLNPTVIEVGKFAYMSKETKMYQALSHMTQLSDFVARYTLYQHVTTRSKDPLSVDEAVQEVSDSFINYDVLLHRYLDYSDSMGLTMFSKYFIRIQRVLVKLLQDHPGSVMTMMVADYFMDLTTVLDSSVFSRIGSNPFGVGAAGIVTMGDDLLTMKALGIMQ